MAERVYSYRGPASVAREVQGSHTGTSIHSLGELRDWLNRHPEAESEGATFVVTTNGVLRLAPRRTEHVACAEGAPVLAAGEIIFAGGSDTPRVIEATNQSIGYCPEPESWPALAAALGRIGLAPPERYTREFLFRLCQDCGQLNIVKENWFYCSVCDAPLPAAWNIGAEPTWSQS